MSDRKHEKSSLFLNVYGYICNTTLLYVERQII